MAAPDNRKPVVFRDTSLADLRKFPKNVIREVGYQLDQAQHGLDPVDWKPVITVGPGVREIRVRDEHGAFRVLYVAKFKEAIYVLHCFQKKTGKASRKDIDLAQHRYRALVKEITP